MGDEKDDDEVLTNDLEEDPEVPHPQSVVAAVVSMEGLHSGHFPRTVVEAFERAGKTSANPRVRFPEELEGTRGEDDSKHFSRPASGLRAV